MFQRPRRDYLPKRYAKFESMLRRVISADLFHLWIENVKARVCLLNASKQMCIDFFCFAAHFVFDSLTRSI